MGAFLGATSPKRTMVFGSWLGPQCQSYQQDQKNLAAIQAGNRQVPEQAHKRASVPDQGQLHVKWLIVFENGKTTHFQNGSQRFKYLVGTSGLAKKERDRDREAQSQQWQSVCN